MDRVREECQAIVSDPAPTSCRRVAVVPLIMEVQRSEVPESSPIRELLSSHQVFLVGIWVEEIETVSDGPSAAPLSVQVFEGPSLRQSWVKLMMTRTMAKYTEAPPPTPAALPFFRAALCVPGALQPDGSRGGTFSLLEAPSSAIASLYESGWCREQQVASGGSHWLFHHLEVVGAYTAGKGEGGRSAFLARLHLGTAGKDWSIYSYRSVERCWEHTVANVLRSKKTNETSFELVRWEQWMEESGSEELSVTQETSVRRRSTFYVLVQRSQDETVSAPELMVRLLAPTLGGPAATVLLSQVNHASLDDTRAWLDAFHLQLPLKMEWSSLLFHPTSPTAAPLFFFYRQRALVLALASQPRHSRVVQVETDLPAAAVPPSLDQRQWWHVCPTAGPASRPVLGSLTISTRWPVQAAGSETAGWADVSVVCALMESGRTPEAFVEYVLSVADYDGRSLSTSFGIPFPKDYAPRSKLTWHKERVNSGAAVSGAGVWFRLQEEELLPKTTPSKVDANMTGWRRWIGPERGVLVRQCGLHSLLVVQVSLPNVLSSASLELEEASRAGLKANIVAWMREEVVAERCDTS